MTDQSQDKNQQAVEAALKPFMRRDPPTQRVIKRDDNEAVPRFVQLADNIHDAAIEAARNQVIKAENFLRQVEQEAAEVRARNRKRWEDLQQLERDLEDMSSDMLQAINRHDGVKK